MPSFLRSLTQNWQLKTLALALAVLLWVVVSAEQVTSNWIPVPIRVRIADPEFQLRNASVPEEVEVRFSGPGRELWDLVIRRPPLVLSIDEVNNTQMVVPLEARMVQIPSQLSVSALDVRPNMVSLSFDRVQSRIVPVRVRLGERLDQGWTLVEPLRVLPEGIRLSGKESVLAEIDTLFTVPITLGPGDSVFSRVVPIDTSGLQGVRLSATQVRISGQVEQVLEREFSQVPVSVGRGVEVRPETVSVLVRGARSKVLELSPGDFRVVVAIDSIPGQIPPEGLEVPLRVERLAPGMQASVQPNSVSLLPGQTLLDDLLAPQVGASADTL